MQQTVEQLNGSVHHEYSPAAHSALPDLRNAIVQALASHAQTHRVHTSNPTLREEISAGLVLPDIQTVESMESVWWLLSIYSVSLLFDDGSPKAVALYPEPEYAYKEIRLSTQNSKLLEKFVNTNRPIARCGLWNVYVTYSSTHRSLELAVREQSHLSDMMVPSDVKLILPDAKPVVEAASRGSIESADYDAVTQVVTYRYVDGTQWQVARAHSDFAVHQRIANGEYVRIGEELSDHVVYFNGAFIETENGRKIARESIVVLSPDHEKLLELIEATLSCKQTSVKGADGVLELTLNTGEVRQIDSTKESFLYIQLAAYFLDKRPVDIGRTSNGKKLYFGAQAGLLLGNLERKTVRPPAELEKMALFQAIHFGSNYVLSADGTISSFILGRQQIANPEHVLFSTVKSLCEGKAGSIFVKNEKSLDQLQSGTLYVLFMTDAGLTYQSYDALELDGELEIIDFPTNFNKELFSFAHEALQTIPLASYIWSRPTDVKKPKQALQEEEKPIRPVEKPKKRKQIVAEKLSQPLSKDEKIKRRLAKKEARLRGKKLRNEKIGKKRH